MSTKSNLRCKVSDLVTFTAALLILPVGSTLAQEWTLDEDQLVIQRLTGRSKVRSAT